MNHYYVYILTNWKGNVMYIGVTNDLKRRLYEHKHELIEGFTKSYHVHKLVYYEETGDVRAAIEREKQLKNWSRAKKNALVETMNPRWEELSKDWE
ncbi:MAG: GIY-YIG nuclease family protein [Oscillospiraceae bacterium]|nr:GIY-YIG nuclease family protein [Oscillospiraceae bacterium]